jgi:hypothetical protein
VSAQDDETMARRHSWEEDSPPKDGGGRHSWEDPSDDGSEGNAAPVDSDEDEPHLVEPTAAEELLAYMLDLYFMRRLNAKELCTISHWAAKCGVAGCDRLAKPPGTSSGHYSRHLHSVLGFTSEEEHGYRLSVPGSQQTYGLGRTPWSLYALAAHEIIDAKVDASSRLRLAEAVEAEDLPPCYYSHPLVRKYGSDGPVFAYALYLDGVPYCIEDTVIGFWLKNLVTGERTLFLVVRRRTLCTCGCRGWCTLFPLFLFVKWVLKAMGEGVMPIGRHDYMPWGCLDTVRSAKAGTALRAHHAVLWVAGDWSEYAHTLGFPGWNDGLRPCFECNADIASMLELAPAVTPERMPWRLNTEGDYFAACARCERWVTLDAPTHRAVVRLLMYDKRDDGSHGRALISPGVPTLGLRAGDRLEPHEGLLDIGSAFDSLDCSTPQRVLFWRPSLEYLTRHRNPLFDMELGITPQRSLTVDLLHCIYLGVLLGYCKLVVWHLLLAGKWGRLSTLVETVQYAALRLKHDLETWYSSRHQLDRTEKLTRAHVTAAKVGSSSDPKLRLKGAETYGVFLYLVDVLGADGARWGPEGLRYLEAGASMKRCLEIMAASRPKVSDADRAEPMP